MKKRLLSSLITISKDGEKMITFEVGNLLLSDAQALVNTVNTEGVMGKGIALQFKEE